MTRAAVTVVVSPVQDPRATRRCLDRLRPALRVRDEIVLLVPVGAPAPHPLPAGVRTLDVAAGESTAAAVQRAAAGARTPLVAELHADVTVTPHWLDRLAAALDDPTVAAAVPRSNQAPVGQAITTGPPAEDFSSIRAFAVDWARRHRDADPIGAGGDLSSACRVRRAPVPGPCEGATVIVPAVYVHHSAEPGCPDLVPVEDPAAPLLSASMIVKDEEDLIAGAIDAVTPFVDEVVVYDTGSSDRTRDIAAEHGATVVTGYWDDDFGAARNRSLAHCSGRWVVWVDADEITEGDPTALRTQLAVTSAEGLVVPIHNLSAGGAGAGFDHAAMRLFRRATGGFHGRLHEQVVHAALGRGVLGEPVDGLRIVHSGYLGERLAAKDKGNRNVELARRALDDERDNGSRAGAGRALANLGRSTALAGDHVGALPLFAQAWEEELTDRVQRETANAAFGSAFTIGDVVTATQWLDRLEAAGGDGLQVGTYRAMILAGDGRLDAADALLRSLPEQSVDADGVRVDGAAAAELHARVLLGLGRTSEAGDQLLAALAAGVSDVHLSEHLRVLESSGRPVEELVAALHPRLRQAFLAQCLQLPAEQGERVLEAMWRSAPSTDVLAAASIVAPHVPVLQALEWSARLRGRGLASECPLVALAGDVERSARDRSVAAAVAYESFADVRAMSLLEQALGDVPDEDTDAVLTELRLLAPGLTAYVEPAAAR